MGNGCSATGPPFPPSLHRASLFSHVREDSRVEGEQSKNRTARGPQNSQARNTQPSFQSLLPPPFRDEGGCVDVTGYTRRAVLAHRHRNRSPRKTDINKQPVHQNVRDVYVQV